MFEPATPDAQMLQEAIESALQHLDSFDPESGQYDQITVQLEKLYALRDKNKPGPLDPNQLIAIGANLTGIMLILHFEKIGIVTSKALSFVKLK